MQCSKATPRAALSSSWLPKAWKIISALGLLSPLYKLEVPESPVRVYIGDFLGDFLTSSVSELVERLVLRVESPEVARFLKPTDKVYIPIDDKNIILDAINELEAMLSSKGRK